MGKCIFLFFICWIITAYSQKLELDTTFGNEGTCTNFTGITRAMYVYQDGRTLIAGTISGSNNNQIILRRNLPDGSTDPAFGSNGIRILNYNVTGVNDCKIHMHSSGKIVVLANILTPSSSSRAIITCLFQNGNTDLAFGNSGYQQIPLAIESRIKGLTEFSDGHIFVAGIYRYNGIQFATYFWELSASGKLLSTPSQGISFPPIYEIEDSPERILVLPGDTILIVFSTYDSQFGSRVLHLRRFNRNFQQDQSFGSNGNILCNLGYTTGVFLNSYIRKWNQIIVGGYIYQQSVAQMFLVAYDFVNQSLLYGKVFNPGSAAASINHIVSIPSGGYLATGSSDSHYVMMRFDDEGNLDPGFENAGILSLPFIVSGGGGVSESDPSGNILSVGNDGSNSVLFRFRTTGEVPFFRLLQTFRPTLLSGLMCNSPPVSLGGRTSANMIQYYEWISGPVEVRNDTLFISSQGVARIRIIVQDSGDYAARDSILQFEIGENAECSLNIYELITPNGDGINDVFEIVSPQSYRYSLQLFDRWGKQILSTSSYDNSWDGKNSEPGSYFYLIDITSPVQQTIKGDILLLK